MNENLIQEYLRVYKDQRRIIDESLAKCQDDIKPEHIKQYYNELISMELMGENIKVLFEAEQNAKSRQVFSMP